MMRATLFLQPQGRLVLLALAAHLCILAPLEAAGDAAITFDVPGSGVPGQDYPLLAAVPDTGFSCTDQEFPGYYADAAAEAACQAFHVCQADGRQDSFLCPNGTVFSQQHHVCDWWYNVDCGASKESRKTTIAAAGDGTDRAATTLPAGSSDRTGGEEGAAAKPFHDSTPLTFPNTRQHTRHALPPPTASPAPLSVPAPGNTSHQQAPQQLHPQASPQHTQPSSTPVHPHGQPRQTLEPTHGHQPSLTSLPVPDLEAHHDSVPQPSITHSHYSPHQSFPQHHQQDYETLPQSTGTQNHGPAGDHLPLQLTSAQHPRLPTLFREDFSTRPPLLTPIPSRDEPWSHKLSLSLTPVTPNSVNHANIDISDGDSLAGIQHHFPSLASEQSSFPPQFTKDHAGTLAFTDSLEAENSLTEFHAAHEKGVRYDEVYSATLFPPNIPQVGDVYDAVKRNVLVDVVRGTGWVPSLPARPAATQGSPTKEPFHVPKPQRIHVKQKHNEQPISNRIPRRQSFTATRGSSPSSLPAPLISPGSQDQNPFHPLLQPPHQVLSGHSNPLATPTSLPQSLAALHDSAPSQPLLGKHDSVFPHHVWRPSHGPFPLSPVVSPAPDATFNLLDSPLRTRSIVTATPGSFHVPSVHPTTLGNFKILHEASPLSQDAVATQNSFPAELHDASEPVSLPSVVHKSPAEHHGTQAPRLLPAAIQKSPTELHSTPEPHLLRSTVPRSPAEHRSPPAPPQLPSFAHESPTGHHDIPEPFPLSFGVHESAAGHQGTPQQLSLPPVVQKSQETPSHAPPNSRQSFLVIHETSPLSQGQLLPPHHVMLGTHDPSAQPRPAEPSFAAEGPLEVSGRLISDPRDSFWVIQESSLRVHDPASPAQGRPDPVQSIHLTPTTGHASTHFKTFHHFSS